MSLNKKKKRFDENDTTTTKNQNRFFALTKSCESYSRYNASKDTSYETIETREHMISTHFDYCYRVESETWRKNNDIEKEVETCSRSIEEKENKREKNEVR